MALLGGICVLALVWIARRYPGMNIAVQAALGTAFIIAAELAVGLVVNRALGWQVWDYSRELDVYKRQLRYHGRFRGGQPGRCRSRDVH